MKRIIFILLIFTASMLYATIITVDNNPSSVGDYTSLSSAHYNAIAGDTIYVYPSNNDYDGIDIQKELHLIGVGFNIDSINSTSIKKTSIDGNIKFETGSNGSSIEGFAGNFTIDLYVSNVTIERNELSMICFRQNYINNVFIINNKMENCIRIRTCHNNFIYIINNSFGWIDFIDGSYGSWDNNLYLSNNIFEYIDFGNYTTHDIIMENTVIYGDILGTMGSGSNLIYNICNSNQLPDDGTNILNVDLNTVFEDYANGNYHLSTNSQAIDAGNPATGYNDLDGTRNDIGIYGGPAPFIDSGITELPTIFYLDAPLVGSQQSGLEVEIKATSGN